MRGEDLGGVRLGPVRLVYINYVEHIKNRFY
jgi:hypothetical protein